ncbi:MAG: competence/damage-inducible protein A [Candidatus Dormibacteraceae bacterium]
MVTVVAIGDELLAGFTLDTNSHWLAQRLRLLGLTLKRLTTVRDREEEIVEQLQRDLADPQVTEVLCCGGLGPTPDDRTFAAVAATLGRELIVWEEVRARIEQRVRRMHEAGLLESPELTEGNLRMARIPAGPTRVLRNRRGMAPGALYEVAGKRLFVLPGVPVEMRGIFTEELEPELLAGHRPAVVRELRFQFAAESRFYPVLREVEESHPDVSVGSYPNTETRVLVIRCLGEEGRRVEEVAGLIRDRMRAAGLEGRIV